VKAAVVANGAWDAEWGRELLDRERPDLIIAADGGCLALEAAGREPEVLIGDFDSTPAALLERYNDAGVKVLTYPAEKNETDLELALDYADNWLREKEAAAGEVLLLGAGGGRLDQLLSNVALMLGLAQRGRRVRMVNPGEECWVSGPGQETVYGAAGDTFSVLPLSEQAVLSYEGMYYPLRRQILTNNRTRGVSNLLQKEKALVEVHEGWVMLVRQTAR
jgi:thiamine pyrophosphokinase